MKKHLKFTRWLALLLLLVAGTGAMAQPYNQDPTQTVCVGPQPYYVDPGNPDNTFLWDITPGEAGIDWIISIPDQVSTNVTWLTPNDLGYTLTLTETDGNLCSTTQQVVVIVLDAPTIFDVTGGGSYCTGDPGLAVGLSGSQIGVNYQLQLDGVNVGTPVAGTGEAISFGLQIAAGTYTVTATTTSTPPCSEDMNGNATITIDPLPQVFDVTGGGSYCAGDQGLPIGLSGSQANVNYQLQLNGVNVGTPVAGTGEAISFGLQTAAGSYTVVATSTSTTACTEDMNGSAVIIADPLPLVFDVTGGGSYCAGDPGLAVGLSGSQIDVNYQLKLDGVNVGTPVAGTGEAISFGLQTVAGTYTVVATSTSTTACTEDMNGNAIITIDPLPQVFDVTGGGSYCAGDEGLPVGLSGSQTGVNYQLQLDGVNVGTPMAGTGEAISFGLQTTAGTYTVVASIGSGTSCVEDMNGSAVIIIDPLPLVFDVTGGGSYCAGDPGLAVGLSGSQIDVNYQLKLDGVNVGTPVAGTGEAISFGLQTAAGTYTVVATSTSTTACSEDMNGSATITIDPLPQVFDVTGGGSYCAGDEGLPVGLSGSQTSVNYQLQLDGVNVGTPVAGTGEAISFGLQTAAGTYTVVATSTSTTACTEDMNGNAVITIDPLPLIFDVTGGGSYCADDPGVDVGLSDSQIGVNYQLQLNGVNVGTPVAGTGEAISFGLQTAAGIYTVVASIGYGTACVEDMNGSVTIVINPRPATSEIWHN